MQEKPKKSQHYVPKFYLRNFTFDSDRVNVYDRLEKRYFEANIDNICQEKFLYETKWRNAAKELGNYVLLNKLENSFVDDEGKYDTLIKALLSKRSNYELWQFAQNKKDAFAELVVNFYLRNPIVLNGIVDSYDVNRIKDNKTIVAVSELFNVWQWGSPESLIEHSLKRSTFDKSIDNGPSSVLKQQLMNMKIMVIRNKLVPFITSCFPIVLNQTPGTPPAVDILNIILPVSPNMAIRFTNDPAYNQEYRKNTIETNDDLVRNINSLYLDYSIEQARFLLSNSLYILKLTVNSSIE